MRFIVPINPSDNGESQTCHVVNTGTGNGRTNKKILREYFQKMGVPPNRIKTVMRAMGFWGKMLWGKEDA